MRNRTRRKGWLYSLFIWLVMGVYPILSSQPVLADDTQKNVGFTVSTELPENQLDPSKTYFYLSVRPNQEQDVYVVVQSIRKEPVTVQLRINNTVTNSQGELENGQENPVLDTSLKVPLTDIVTIPEEFQTVTVENFKSKRVPIHVKVPKEPFDGIKLGAIRYSVALTEEEKKGISNTYGYTTSFILTEDNEYYNTGGDLVLKQVEAKIDHGSKVVAATFQNPNPKVLDSLSIATELTHKGEKVILKRKKVDNMRMAPNSRFDFITPWGVDELPSGYYTLHIRARAKGYEWKWDESFEVPESVAKKINRDAAYKLILPRYMDYMGGLLIVLTLVMMFYLLNQQKKPKYSSNSRRRRS